MKMKKIIMMMKIFNKSYKDWYKLLILKKKLIIVLKSYSLLLIIMIIKFKIKMNNKSNDF
jgi:hypothetical protein